MSSALLACREQVNEGNTAVCTVALHTAAVPPNQRSTARCYMRLSVPLGPSYSLSSRAWLYSVTKKLVYRSGLNVVTTLPPATTCT